jgi:hypothetical protein
MPAYQMLLGLVKPATLLGYAAFGGFLLCVASDRWPRSAVPARVIVLGVAGLFGAAVIMVLRGFALHGGISLIWTALGTLVFLSRDNAWRRPKLILAAVAIVTATITMAWWLMNERQAAAWWQFPAFAAIAWAVQAGLLQSERARSRRWTAVLLATFAVAGFCIIANMASFQPGSDAIWALIHHWGAYLGPAQYIRAGLVPFYDVPLQYGLGPTLTIAAGCAVSGCWSALEFLTVTTTIVMGLLLLNMALSTTVPRGSIWSTAVTIAVLVSVFVFPGFLNLGPVPIATPSTSGMRFLPVTLVAFALFHDRPNWAAAALVPAILWAPEVCGMAVAVFGLCETARVGLIKATCRTAAIVVASLLALVMVHRLTFGVWLQPDVMAEYIIHVPGAGSRSMDLFSDYLVLAAALGLAAWTLSKQVPRGTGFRRNLVCASLLFAAASYYLGHDHPNNVNGIMPFIVLVALRALDSATLPHFPTVSRLAVLGIASTMAVTTLSLWQVVPFQHGFSTSIDPVIAAAVTMDPDMVELRSRIVNPDHESVAEIGQLYARNPTETTVWTPLDPYSLWAFVPSARRQLYFKRAAARLHRPGWAIIRNDEIHMLDDLRSAYQVTQQNTYELLPSPDYVRKFQSSADQPTRYTIVHLVPIDDPAGR